MSYQILSQRIFLSEPSFEVLFILFLLQYIDVGILQRWMRLSDHNCPTLFFDNKPTLFILQVRKILEGLHIKNSLPGDRLWTFASAILISASKIKEN